MNSQHYTPVISCAGHQNDYAKKQIEKTNELLKKYGTADLAEIKERFGVDLRKTAKQTQVKKCAAPDCDNFARQSSKYCCEYCRNKAKRK